MGLPATDDFVGGAGALAGSWTQQKTTVTLNRDGSGAAVSSSGTDEGFAFWNADPFSPDQYSKAIIASGLGSGTGYVQISVRCSPDVGNAAFDQYLAYTDGVTGAGHTEIAKTTNGTAVVLKAVAATFTAGDEIMLTARAAGAGVVLTLYKNGVEIDTTTDSTSPFTSGSAGAGAFGTGKLASWEGGALGVLVGSLGTRRAFGGRGSSRAINSPSGPFDQRGFLRQRLWDYTLLAATATVFNVDVAESVTVVDTQTAQADLIAGRSDALSVAETEDGSFLFTVTRSDALTAADTETGIATFSSGITEAGTAVDSQTGLAVFASTRTEALTAADTETGQAVFANAVSDALTAADSETGIAVFGAARVEALSAADSSDGNVGAAIYNVTRTESLAASDTEVATAVFSTARTEALTAADSEASTAVFAAARAESLAATDSETGAWTTAAAISEILSASDSSTGVSASSVTFTFRITGGPVMVASVAAGGVLVASITGGRTFSSGITGGPV